MSIENSVTLKPDFENITDKYAASTSRNVLL